MSSFLQTMDAHSLGEWGEWQAAKFLQKHGFKILLKGYRCKMGEIDLVAREQDILVFVEVKTRQTIHYGDPASAVTPQKQRHICRVALDYLRRLRNPEIPVRFDIVEVVPDGSSARCTHYRDAFAMSEPYIY
ncbi:MAG: YraN family protein [Verrucomicrobiae bacterium]|nr:YraN family protein [Verrucomicrobiae bacterium]